jgi:hypothetical protein
MARFRVSDTEVTWVMTFEGVDAFSPTGVSD